MFTPKAPPTRNYGEAIRTQAPRYDHDAAHHQQVHDLPRRHHQVPTCVAARRQPQIAHRQHPGRLGHSPNARPAGPDLGCCCLNHALNHALMRGIIYLKMLLNLLSRQGDANATGRASKAQRTRLRPTRLQPTLLRPTRLRARRAPGGFTRTRSTTSPAHSVRRTRTRR